MNYHQVKGSKLKVHQEILKRRYVIKGLVNEGSRPVELAHPENSSSHPLSYMELPFDPEYTLYNNRMTPEFLNNVSPDDQYWAVRQGVILRNTGEFPVEISGPEAEKFANFIFTREMSKFKPGRCSYQFACLYNGGMITDGVMLHLKRSLLWMAQADGELFKWYQAHANGFDVVVRDPKVWVSQIQGPKSMQVLSEVIDGEFPRQWNYFDLAEVRIAGDPVIITRTGFTNELGWEIYFRPENNCELIGKKIWEVGQKYNIMLCGTPAFRARRIEAGLLSAGADFNELTTPYEVGLGQFVDLKKDDFIGKTSLMQSNKNNKLWGIKVRGGIARKGDLFAVNGPVIGKITSSTWSPYLECGVGIVRVEDCNVGPGDEVATIGLDGKEYFGKLCTLPMYDEKGLIVRGKYSDIPTQAEPWVG
tara:strand:+ start:1177 stop:2433 length:1257 start_codon:yes stop_codon:yes gene_type:complete